MARNRTMRAWTFQRAGSIDTNPTTFAQKSSAFATASTTQFNSVTLIATRDDDGVHGYLVSPDRSGMDAAALNLAHAVGARVSHLDSPPELTGPGREVVGRLHFIPGQSGGLVQAGADPAEVVRTLAQSMPTGSWVGVSIRRPARMEKSRWFDWIATRPGGSQSHHTRQTNYPVITSIYAATSSRAQTRSLLNQVAGILPGFDMNVGTQIPSRVGAALVPFVLPALLAAAVFIPQMVADFFPEVLGELPPRVVEAVFTNPRVSIETVLRATGLAAVIGAVVALGLIPSRWSRLRSAIRAGHLPRPYSRLVPAKRGKVHNFEHKSEMGEYPLDSRAFMVAPHLLTTLVAPHAGAMSGISSTRSRAVPAVMTSRIGPLVGHADTTPVHLSALDLAHGWAAVGRPGSGKSIQMQNLFAWSMLERTRPCGEPGFPGARNTLVAFEPKLDGAQAYMQWSAAIGDDTKLVEVANPASVSIDLFAIPGTVSDRAEFATESLRYAFDDGAIQGASAEALRAVIAGGMVVTDDMVTALQRGAGGGDPIPTIETGRSFFYYAHVLLGGLGDVPAVALAQQIEQHANAATEAGQVRSDLAVAHARLSPLFAGRTPAQRAAYSQAPRNKLDALASVDHFFAPGRPKATWAGILDRHRSVVVLTGVDSAGHMMSTNAERLMSSLLMYTLRDAIERTCSGWEAAARWVSVFVDELSMIAGSDPEIITWLKNRGRSYGVRPFFATQYPTQLHPQVRESFLSFSTLVTYTLDNPEIAREVVADLSGDGTDWTVSDVLELAPFHAIVRANVGRQRQPPFPFKAGYWAASPASRAQFVIDQGYPPAPAPGALGSAHPGQAA